MDITIQNLQALSNVTSLSQVHIVEGHAEARGGLKAAFQKIADFFKGWTASGRAPYIAENSDNTPIFHADVTLTMRIHLDQPPSGTVEHPNGTAYIPTFSLEGVSLTYGAPQPGEV